MYRALDLRQFKFSKSDRGGHRVTAPGALHTLLVPFHSASLNPLLGFFLDLASDL